MKRLFYSLFVLSFLLNASEEPKIPFFKNKRGFPLRIPDHFMKYSVLKTYSSDVGRSITLGHPEFQDEIIWEKLIYFTEMDPGALVDAYHKAKIDLSEIGKLIECYHMARSLELPIVGEIQTIIKTKLKDQNIINEFYQLKGIPTKCNHYGIMNEFISAIPKQPFWQRYRTYLTGAGVSVLALSGYGLYKWHSSK